MIVHTVPFAFLPGESATVRCNDGNVISDHLKIDTTKSIPDVVGIDGKNRPPNHFFQNLRWNFVVGGLFELFDVREFVRRLRIQIVLLILAADNCVAIGAFDGQLFFPGFIEDRGQFLRRQNGFTICGHVAIDADSNADFGVSRLQDCTDLFIGFDLDVLEDRLDVSGSSDRGGKFEFRGKILRIKVYFHGFCHNEDEKLLSCT
jgi:hypothetical protein